MDRSSSTEHQGASSGRPSCARARWLAGLVLCTVVIATVVIDLVLWRRAEPDLGDGAVDQPSWVLVAALASVSLVAFAVLGWRPARTRNLRVPFTVLMLVVTGLAIWPAIWFVEGVPVPAYLLHAPPTAAPRQAQQALGEASAGGTSVTVRHDPTHLLPTPYQRCAYLDPG